MKRYYRTERFADQTYRALSPSAKLCLLRIESACDAAGFWRVNEKEIAESTGVPQSEVGAAIEELENSGWVIRATEYVWVPGFLGDQGITAISDRNNAHKAIRNSLTAMDIVFASSEAYLDRRSNLFAVKPEPYSRHKKRYAHRAPAVPRQCPVAAPAVPPAPPAPTAEEIATPIPPCNVVSSRETINQIRNAPKDWAAIKQSCMGYAQGRGLADKPLYDALSDWFDNLLVRGNPYELPMWRCLIDEVLKYGPQITIEAIRYSVANNMPRVNFEIAKRYVEEREVRVSQDGRKLNLSETRELEGWQKMFRRIFPDARVNFKKWCEIPRDIQIQLEKAAAA